MRISPFSRSYLRKRASDKMEDLCEIWRHGTLPLNKATGVVTTTKQTLLYSGKCRIWQVVAGTQVLMGDEQIVMSTTYLSLPYDAYVPNYDDIIHVIKTSDPALNSSYFHVVGTSFSGGLRASRRFTVDVLSSPRREEW